MTDYLTAASDPRVVAIVLARDLDNAVAMRQLSAETKAALLVTSLRDNGITATEDRARFLLNAVAAWKESDDGTVVERACARVVLTAAATATVRNC